MPPSRDYVVQNAAATAAAAAAVRDAFLVPDALGIVVGLLEGPLAQGTRVRDADVALIQLVLTFIRWKAALGTVVHGAFSLPQWKFSSNTVMNGDTAAKSSTLDRSRCCQLPLFVAPTREPIPCRNLCVIPDLRDGPSEARDASIRARHAFVQRCFEEGVTDVLTLATCAAGEVRVC